MGDGDEIAREACRLAEEQAFTPERFISTLEQGWYTDVALGNLPAAQRGVLLPALKAMLGRRSGIVRLHVAQALLELGDPSGSDVFVKSLTDGDRKLQRAALRALTSFPRDAGTLAYRVPIDADALFAALDYLLAGGDRWEHEQAVYVLHRLATPRAFDRPTELLGDARPDVRAEAAIWLGRAGRDRGALFVIEEMLAMPHPKRYHLVAAVERLCKSADADVGSRAAACKNWQHFGGKVAVLRLQSRDNKPLAAIRHWTARGSSRTPTCMRRRGSG